MADENETAPMPEKEDVEDHGHCSDCENEEHHLDDGDRGDDTGAKKKKRKQKKKKKTGATDAAKDPLAKARMDVNSLPADKLQEIQKAIELFSVGQGPAKTMEEATRRSYQFWDTQPVPKLGETVTSHGCIEPDKDSIREEPYSLPQGFSWDTLDLGNSAVLKELYTLLNENYVEDDDNMFRFDYSPEFLLWALRPPGWLPQWHCGVRVNSNQKLVGFISAIPATIRIYDVEKRMVEINFLCVHKKLRSKRVAPVLIREITRRVNLQGIFQAVYTAGVVLPKPVGTCRYWHRSLNPRKLIEVKFSHLSRNMTMQRTMKLYRLPEAPKTSGLRPMTKKDVPVVHRLLREYLSQFNLVPAMNQEEVEHWLLPRENIIDTFLVENNGKVTDFLSFYTLPSTIMNHPVHHSLKAAYSFYNVHTVTPLLDLMQDALILAKSKGFDVFNALDLMENKTFLEKLKFGIGDGNLQYYLYNWKCPSMGADKYVFGSSGPNPFEKDTREPLKPMVHNRKEKNKVLKQGFLVSKVPEDLDAIVIGSGIGGLGLAVLLAKVGKKVLVLEQHDRAGGCCHTFSEKGYEFDVGIHYIGDLLDHKPFRCMLDQMTDGQLQWEPLENPFDQVVIGPPENRRRYPIYSGRTRFPEELKKCFPGEEKAIDEYLKLVKKASRGIWLLAVLKICPAPLAKLLVSTGLAKRLSFFFKMASRSLTEVVNELTDNKDLRAVFSYIFGTYGNMPKDASFSMHSLLVSHYLNGAWYPKGGATEIAYHMIPIIEKAGGAVLVRAPVNRILFNDAREACGVSVMKGQEEVHIRAPVVISDAGIFNTYQTLLPRELQALPEIQKQLSLMKNGEGGLSIFLGLSGTKEELGLKADNYWIFTENNFDELVGKYLSGEKEDSARNVPLLFVASPSAKDPTWEERSPGKSTLSLVTFANYKWFEEWKDDKVTNRGAEYKELKRAFLDSILEVVMDVFPQITREKIEYVDAGTPVTNTHYIGAPKGEIYGADHGVARFSPELNATVRPRTPLKNLYLTGQSGRVPVRLRRRLAGALTCGSVLLNRNLHLDAIGLAKRTKRVNDKLKGD
ncbi:putative all-trans-retinol 13,14-reductase [Takifugu flavidus]|uniref:All-trans-retinol 13,14-reductase n=1 Tax=Takifugu flavidus TaxID=433684 RepID=A0A5C6NTF6_9TELE|nr:putative all-trans-retinol 13,14-reductase [Takifugu flavidus]